MEERRKSPGRPTNKALSRMLVDVDQPTWVCYTCGRKYGSFKPGTCTWHKDTCGVCGKDATVTEPRDFGYLLQGWRKKYDEDGSAGSV